MAKIPQEAAQEIMNKFNLDQVIILGYERSARLYRTATFGRTEIDSKQAADGAINILGKLGLQVIKLKGPLN